MILKPMVRNNICINAHPLGCAVEVERQIGYIRERSAAYRGLPGPRAALVIGASTGYGLASRIAAAIGFGAATIGVSFEKPASESKTGTPGWYANRAFDGAAARAGVAARSIDGDAFSDEIKAEVVRAARELGIRFDLVVYSLASPVRKDPRTGELYRSVIKPIGGPYRGRNVDVFTQALSYAEIQGAADGEVAQTVKVMGGEDWKLWIDALRDAGVLAEGATTLAYSYVGPKLSWPIYRDGTIGRAKADLEAAARELRELSRDGLAAYVSINKALVTRASAVIPVIPLYVSVLFKVMKERGIHEDCVAQIDRLYRERLYRATATGGAGANGARNAGAGAAASGMIGAEGAGERGAGALGSTAGPSPARGAAARAPVPLDAESRIRVDELEMGAAVQAEVESRMARIGPENLEELADVAGFRTDFLRAHGFAVEGVDYEAEVSPLGASPEAVKAI